MTLFATIRATFGPGNQHQDRHGEDEGEEEVHIDIGSPGGDAWRYAAIWPRYACCTISLSSRLLAVPDSTTWPVCST